MNTIAKLSADKGAFDHEAAFRNRVKAVKLMGMWVAEQLRLDGDAAETYARGLVAVDQEEAGDEDVMRKLLADLGPLGFGRAELQDRLTAFLAQTAR